MANERRLISEGEEFRILGVDELKAREPVTVRDLEADESLGPIWSEECKDRLVE
jgi:hypothetical protein